VRLPLSALIILATILLIRATRPRGVEVVHPVERAVAQAITISGQVTGLQQSVLAPEASGVLTALYVTEGQVVQPGQRIGQVSSADAEAALQQAQAAVLSAQARVREAEANADNQALAVRQAQAQSAQALRVASARVIQAREDLRRARALAGSSATARAALRRAEAALAQAEAGVVSARAAARNDEVTRQRMERLYAQGAVSAAQRDQAVTAAATAEAAVGQAEAQRNAAAVEVENQRELLTQTRTQAVQQAETNLAAAEADLAAAEESGPAAVAAAQRAPVQVRVAQARADLAQAVRAREVAQARVNKTAITARFPARITAILSYPGNVVGPSRGVVRVTTLNAEVTVPVDERDIARVRAGQSVMMVADAYPDQKLAGVVSLVGAAVDPQRGTVDVRVRPLAAPPWLRAGLTMDVTIIVESERPHLLVPSSAIVRAESGTAVFVVEGGRVVRRPITAGTVGAVYAVVLAGLTGADWVVLQPLQTREGVRVAIRPRRWEGL
jgi:HlyD family secretion protein